MKDKEVDLLEKGLQKVAVTDNTLMLKELEKIINTFEERKEEKEKLI